MRKQWVWFFGILLILGFGVLYFLRFYSAQAIFPVRGQYLKVDKYKLYITQQGEGRTLLFLHGFPFHSEAYDSLNAKPWPGYRCITVDFPGCGLSEKNLAAPVNPEELAVLIKLVLDKLEIKEADIVGHDLGGGVALILTSLFPNVIQRLILIAPDSSAGSAATTMGWWWSTPVLAELVATVFLNRDYIRRLLQENWTDNSDTWHQLVERYYRPLETTNGRRGFLNLNRGRYGFDYAKFEEQLKIPCLLIWGEQDTITPLSSGQRLLQSLGNAKMEVLPGVGHIPQEQAPEAVRTIIQNYLSTTPVLRSRDSGASNAELSDTLHSERDEKFDYSIDHSESQ